MMWWWHNSGGYSEAATRRLVYSPSLPSSLSVLSVVALGGESNVTRAARATNMTTRSRLG